MADSHNPRDIQKHLVRTAENGIAPADQELIFDPQTGQLVVHPRGVPQWNPDAVVADQITQDGFFGKYHPL